MKPHFGQVSVKKLIASLFALLLSSTALGQVPWLSPTSSQPQNEFLATPNGAAGPVGLRPMTSADLPASPATTLKGNATSSSASPQDLNPLAVANMLSATIAVYAVDTVQLANLSGVQPIDGVSPPTGSVVLLTNELNASVTGYISGNTLTVTATGSGLLNVNATIAVPGASPSTYVITALGTGAGGTGTYTVGASCTSGCGTSGTPVSGITSNGAAQNGLWLVNSGTWTRPANFPSGYVISAGCLVTVIPYAGTVNRALDYTLTNATGTITIDSSGQTWALSGIVNATQAVAGRTKVSGGGDAVLSSFTGSYPVVPYDCVSSDGHTSIDGSFIAGDIPNNNSQYGGCATVEYPSGHLITTNQGAPTASTGTVATASSDQAGAVSGVSASSLTITLGSAFSHAPNCVVQDSAGISAYESSAPSTNENFTGTLTSGSRTVTGTIPTDLPLGGVETITGTGVPTNTLVVGSNIFVNTITLSNAATASGSQTLSYTVYKSVIFSFASALSSATVRYLCF